MEDKTYQLPSRADQCWLLLNREIEEGFSAQLIGSNTLGPKLSLQLSQQAIRDLLGGESCTFKARTEGAKKWGTITLSTDESAAITLGFGTSTTSGRNSIQPCPLTRKGVSSRALLNIIQYALRLDPSMRAKYDFRQVALHEVQGPVMQFTHPSQLLDANVSQFSITIWEYATRKPVVQRLQLSGECIDGLTKDDTSIVGPDMRGALHCVRLVTAPGGWVVRIPEDKLGTKMRMLDMLLLGMNDGNSTIRRQATDQFKSLDLKPKKKRARSSSEPLPLTTLFDSLPPTPKRVERPKVPGAKSQANLRKGAKVRLRRTLSDGEFPRSSPPPEPLPELRSERPWGKIATFGLVAAGMGTLLWIKQKELEAAWNR